MMAFNCWRCDKKLAEQEADAAGVVIVCPRCHAKNRVRALTGAR